MARKNKSKLVKGSVVGALVLSLSGCEVIGLVPMAVYGASLSVGDMLEKREIRAEIQDLEDSGVIPKIDKTNTRAGVDKDNNGIRDDVDHLIEGKAKTKNEILAMEQMARGFQEVQEAKEVNSELYKSYYYKVFGARDCLAWYTSWKPKETSRFYYLVKEITTNTKNRKNRHIELEAARGNSVFFGADCKIDFK